MSINPEHGGVSAGEGLAVVTFLIAAYIAFLVFGSGKKSDKIDQALKDEAEKGKKKDD